MVNDFPKLESPFKREEINNKYVCVPKFKHEFDWIFDKEEVNCSEKFHGTNTSVIIKDGKVQLIYNRKNQIPILGNSSCHMFVEGINNALHKGFFDTDEEKQIFGELCGPKINKNPYKLKEHLWLPFSYIRKKYLYKFWYNFIDEGYTTKIDIKDDNCIYQNLRDLFKNLKSRYAIVNNYEDFAEGVVFYNNKTGEMCKLRRDMFDFFKGDSHHRTKQKRKEE